VSREIQQIRKGKEMSKKLDDLDRSIIGALEIDGRRPYRDIAKDLGVPEGTVRNRVNRLLENNLIEITAVGDPLKLGVNVTAVSLIRVKVGENAKVARLLAEYASVRFVGISLGPVDLIVQTLHPNLQAMYKFSTEELPRVAPEILDVQTFQLHEVVKSSWQWSQWFEAFKDEETTESAL
jgi:Lrp/AsnC family transcriptional regulator, regulator for asnA, asnC and gidA